MEQKQIHALISENMKTVFGFALSRLRDRTEAEELTGEIVLRALRSAHRLTEEAKFYAWLWRIAENTYADHLRRKSKDARSELTEDIADSAPSVEDSLIRREELALLRRELSLLSEQYRRATVLYYMEDLRCSEIARTLDTSVEMVKYYLFRARNILREGMNMERILGEKSYNPIQFEIDFWGTKAGDDAQYRIFRERRILGNILAAAYYAPLSVQELSIELGVAAPYLEDELCLLEKREYIVERNGKYRTNIPVFTAQCREEIVRRTEAAVQRAAEKIAAGTDGAFYAQYGSAFGDACARWQAVMLCCHFAMAHMDGELRNRFGDLPADGPYRLVNGGGGRGVVWGRCMDAETQKAGNGICGIYNGCPAQDGRGLVIAFNFAQILHAQHFQTNMTDPVSCAGVGCFAYLPESCKEWMQRLSYVKNGEPNFPVYTKDEYSRLPQLLKEGIDIFTEVIRETYTIAVGTAAEHAPDHIRSAAGHVGAIVYQFDGMETLADALYECGWLTDVPDTAKPAMCVIRNI